MKKIGLLMVALFLSLVGCAHYIGEEDTESLETDNGIETPDEEANNDNEETDGEYVIDLGHLTIAEAAEYINAITDTETYTLIIYDDKESSCAALKEALNNLLSTTSSGPYISLDLTEATCVTEIGDNAFAGPSSSSAKYALKEIVLPKNCTKIGYQAFIYQAGLQKVVFDKNLLSIGGYAFYECSSLASVDLSQCTLLKSIGEATFFKCTSLTSVDFSQCGNLTQIGGSVFDACSSLMTANLSNTLLESIGDYVFYDCTSLNDLGNNNKLPTTITKIGSRAFDSCSSLKTVNLSGCTSLQSIGDYAFENCSSLKTVNLSGCTSLESIGYDTFYKCTYLESICFTLCTKLQSIGENAFRMCSSLTSIDLSDTILTSIDDGSSSKSAIFDGCTLLNKVVFPQSLTSIGEYAFYNFENLETVDFSQCTSLKSIGGRAFYKCISLTTVDFSQCTLLESIGEYAFYECYSLTSVDLSQCTSLKSIEERVFYECTNLSSIEFPTSLMNIVTYAFCRCTSLTTVDFESCTLLREIEASAFSGCSNLTSVTISPTENDMTWGYSSSSKSKSSYCFYSVSDFERYAAFYLTGNDSAKNGETPEKNSSTAYLSYWYKESM